MRTLRRGAEYTLVGPNGETRTLSMEEGMRWEGLDERSREEDEFDWRGMLGVEEEEEEEEEDDDDDDEDRRCRGDEL